MSSRPRRLYSADGLKSSFFAVPAGQARASGPSEGRQGIQLRGIINKTESAGTWRPAKGVCAALTCFAIAAYIAPVAVAQSTPPPAVPHPQQRLKEGDPVAQHVSIETSPQLFATMCALWAAGYKSEAATSGLLPAWRAVAEQMYQTQGPATEALRKYYQEHEHKDLQETLTRFISFAMVVGPAPDFVYTLRHNDLPPDVLTIEDFNDVLAKFYAEAGVEARWTRIEPAYDSSVALLQAPFTKIVLQTTGYLREVIPSNSPRTFTLYVEPMVGAASNFRSYGDQYAFVYDGLGDPPLTEIRHAFLHFLLDPIAPKYKNDVARVRPLLETALRAPRLSREYKDDLPAFFTECLVKAVELRMDHLTPDARARAADAADADGFVLVRRLVAELEDFQKSEPAMSLYFPALAKNMDVSAENKRLQAVRFAPRADMEPAPVDSAAAAAAEKEQMLVHAEQKIAAHDGAGAQAEFEKILQRWPATPRAEYGLAISAVLQKQGPKAKELFTEIVKPRPDGAEQPDPVVLSWAHVYLGRIHDMEGDRDLALEQYRAALGVQGAPEAARVAAQSGVEKAYQPATRGDRPGEL